MGYPSEEGRTWSVYDEMFHTWVERGLTFAEAEAQAGDRCYIGEGSTREDQMRYQAAYCGEGIDRLAPKQKGAGR